MSVECVSCGEVFDTEQGMKSHHAQVHGESIAGEKFQCEYCDNTFRKTQNKDTRLNFCSPECSSSWFEDSSGKDRHPHRDQCVVECTYCSDKFKVRRSRSDSARFCSRDCMGSWMSENNTGESHPNWSRTNVECDSCGDTFDKPDKRIERSERDFCSDSCRKDWWSDEIREYAPEGEDHHNWNGGVKQVDCSWCGEMVEIPPNRQDYENVFCDQSCYGYWLSDNNIGENHPRWSGGSEQRIYRGSWTKVSDEVRSEYPNCQNCGTGNDEHKNMYGFGLHVHHIEPYTSFDDPDNANRKENLAPLCVECHRKVETIELSVSSPYK